MNDATTRQWPWQAALCTPDRKRKTVLLVGATGEPVGPKEGLQATRSFALDGPVGLAFMSAQAHDGGWGFLDAGGEWRVPPVYEDTRNAAPNGFARFKRGGLWGYMRMTGEVLIEPRFEQCRAFRHGVAAVKVSDKEWRFIDEQGRFTGKRTHHELGDMGEAGLALAMRWNFGGRIRNMGFVNREGEWVISPDFGQAEPFGPHPVTAVRKEQDKLYGLINTQGQWVLEPCHGSIGTFDADGFASFRDATARDHKYGFLGLQGQVLIEPQVNMAQHRICGLARQGCSFWQADGTRLDTQGIHMATDFRPLGRVALVRVKHFVADQDWSDQESNWGLLHTDGRVVSMPEHLREPLTDANDWLLAERGDTPYTPFIDRNGDLVWVDSKFHEVARVHLATGSAQMHTAAGEVWSSTDTSLGPVQPFFDPPASAVLQGLTHTDDVWPLLTQLRASVEERLHQLAAGEQPAPLASDTKEDGDDDDDDWDDEDEDEDESEDGDGATPVNALVTGVGSRAEQAEGRQLARLTSVQRRLARHYISEEQNGPYQFLCDDWGKASRGLREDIRKALGERLGPMDAQPEWAGHVQSYHGGPGWAVSLTKPLPGDDGSRAEHRQLWACVYSVEDSGDGDQWWETWLLVAPSVDALALALRARRGHPARPPAPDEAATIRLLTDDPHALEHIPREHLSDAMIDAAMQANPATVVYVPRRLMTAERYTAQVQAGKLRPSQVPPDMLTEACCLAHVSNGGWGLTDVPEPWRTPAVCLLAMQKSASVQKHVPAAVLDELRAAGHEIPDPNEQWRKLRKKIDATLERVNASKADPVMQMLLDKPKTPWQRVRRGLRLAGWMLSSAVKPRTTEPATHRGLTGWLEIRPVMSLITNTVLGLLALAGHVWVTVKAFALEGWIAGLATAVLMGLSEVYWAWRFFFSEPAHPALGLTALAVIAYGLLWVPTYRRIGLVYARQIEANKENNA